MLPLQIFLAELCVVTVGTLRIIFVARGHRRLAPILGLFEILTWLFAIGQTMQNLDNLWCCAAFALGFTAGNVLGMAIERTLAMGTVLVRVFTPLGSEVLTAGLRAAGFGYTSVEGKGATGPVRIIMAIVKRRQLDDLLGLVDANVPGAFYAVDEVQSASQGIFVEPEARRGGFLPGVLTEAWSRVRLQTTAKPQDAAQERAFS